MNNLKLSSFQKIFCQNFATKAKIKFLGKRSLLNNNNHNELNNNNNNSNNLNNQNNKSFSNDINNQNYFSINKYRINISEEESDIINNGGPIKIRDWTKIKLKPKNILIKK
jgi:hypothetical protein